MGVDRLVGITSFYVFETYRSEKFLEGVEVFRWSYQHIFVGPHREAIPRQQTDRNPTPRTVGQTNKRTMSSYLAKKAAQNKVSSLLEPLLSDEESSDDETNNSEEYEIAKQSPLQKLKTMGVYTMLTAGVGLSVAAMLISPMTLVFIAGGICCAK